jgi:hypothetical protein
MKAQQKAEMRKLLLSCGIVSSLWYIAMNIVVPFRLEGYDWTLQTVSELSAIGVPTRQLWVNMAALYSLLLTLFGSGICISANGKQSLKLAGILVIAYGIIGLAWPPMHQRAAIAAGQGSLTDTMHIVFTFVTVLIMTLVIILAALSFGKRFLFYSIVTIVALFVFGVLTGLNAPLLEKNLPTPWMGIWERVSIGVYVAWIGTLAILLLKHESNNVRIGTRFPSIP